MEEDRPLTREEIEDILDRFHIQEYEWFIEDEEDEFCSSSEEDAELVEKAIKSLINQYKNDYISKDKIREKIKDLKNNLKSKEEQNEYFETLAKIEILEEISRW